MAKMTPRTLSGFMELLPQPQQHISRRVQQQLTVGIDRRQRHGRDLPDRQPEKHRPQAEVCFPVHRRRSFLS